MPVKRKKGKGEFHTLPYKPKLNYIRDEFIKKVGSGFLGNLVRTAAYAYGAFKHDKKIMDQAKDLKFEGKGRRKPKRKTKSKKK
jgi:hypothetical protein